MDLCFQKIIANSLVEKDICLWKTRGNLPTAWLRRIYASGRPVATGLAVTMAIKASHKQGTWDDLRHMLF